MKTHCLYLCAVVLLFASCAKEKVQPATPPSTVAAKLSYLSVDQIPNDIVPLLYQDLIKDKLYDQANQLSKEYYATLSARKDDNKDLLKAVRSASARAADIAAANLPTHNVNGVGVVLNGNWYQTVGTASANLQAIGWTDYNFNIMNSTAPDAFSTTLPAANQIIGTTGQSRRMEAIKLPNIQFGAADETGTTYFTGDFGFTYKAHVEAIGWQGYVTSPYGIAGTVGQSRRMEAIQIYGPRYGNPNFTLTFNDSAPSTTARPYIYYRVHQDSYGWEGWVSENDVAGITGASKRLEAIQIRAYLIKI
ncbi:hypothetical protein [Chitinophaga sp.]|uniref:hypothetical protein n=1 Tax=Chitinophaga sp. TaxID=1869181 RepID=UPI0031D2567B